VRRAEKLGFSRAWFYDTQMLSADPFVAMAAAALKTTWIRLGAGVLIPSNRWLRSQPTPLTSLNKLAPGRIDFGVGTGFTGRRSMGLGVIKLGAMEEYFRVVPALLRGETVETEIEGKSRLIRLLNPELGLINTRDPVGLYVAAAGPRVRQLTAKMGENSIATSGASRAWSRLCATSRRVARGGTRKRALRGGAADRRRHRRSGRTGRQPAGDRPGRAARRHAAAPCRRCVVGRPAERDPGAAHHRRRCRWLCRAGAPVPSAGRARPRENHRGHPMSVKPAERRFVTAELIHLTSLTGPEQEIKERIAAFAEAGYGEIASQIILGQENAIEDWGRIRRVFV
jgi:5,10-methylenetetrahydromethanopterin reductase